MLKQLETKAVNRPLKRGNSTYEIHEEVEEQVKEFMGLNQAVRDEGRYENVFALDGSLRRSIEGSYLL